MKRTAPLVAALLLAAPLASRPEEPQKLTIDTSGWLILNTYANSGALNANDLPRYAKGGPSDEEALGLGVRQSRLRLNIGIPSEGLLLDAKLKGLVELDFMGGNAVGTDDPSLPLVRLRHAWVSAAWPRLGNLSVLVGQTWGIVGGPYFAQSLSHLATPRFAGAGFLYRRAPQIRVSGDVGQTFGVAYQVGRARAVRSRRGDRRRRERRARSGRRARGRPERRGAPRRRLPPGAEGEGGAGRVRPLRQGEVLLPADHGPGEGRHHRQPCVRARSRSSSSPTCSSPAARSRGRTSTSSIR